jgi:hypothetical protein
MDAEGIVRGLIQVPEKFHSSGNVSMNSLLREAGYPDAYDSITEEMIANALTECPKYIDYWIQLSEDDRSDSRWYLKRNDDQKYILGHYNSKKRISKETEYSDGTLACAAYIKRRFTASAQNKMYPRHRKPKKSAT